MLQAVEPRVSIDLGGMWAYKLDPDNNGAAQGWYEPALDRSDWGQMQIPKNWYLTEVGDYFGAAWFATSFRVPDELEGQHLTLRFRAVDYTADVWLNGEYLGHHLGYFTPFEFDVSDKVRVGADNVLVVRDNAPRDPTTYERVDRPPWNSDMPLSEPYQRHWAKDLTLIKGHHIDAMHRPGAMTKYRGDGNSGGIWQTVELIGRGQAQINRVRVYPKIVAEDGSALITIDLDLNNSTDDLIETEVVLTIRPKNFWSTEIVHYTKPVQLQPGANSVKLVQTIEKPHLWWTWDHGKPNLYQAEVTLGPTQAFDRQTETFGIKLVEQDYRGHWYLNGKRIFLRGMRYLSSLWISEMDRERYRVDLAHFPELNINAVRIGSHVELDEFYDLCDEMGLLVWQVFPLHYCYSDSDELIQQAAPMMKQMVELLYNHACIGMWSVFKEPKVYGLSDPPNNYGRLCQIMWEAGASADPTRWVHKGDYEEGVQNLMIGCVRDGDTDVKQLNLEPNIVEFGCGAIPVRETLESFIPEDKLWPPDWDTWEYYGLFYYIMFNRARIQLGNSLEEFIDNSQRYAARNIKEQIEFCRQRKYNPIGSMYLYYFNDSAPLIGCGLLDYYRRPYQSYEAFMAVYTPVLVSLEWNKQPYHLGWQKTYRPGETFIGALWITNDHLAAIQDVTLRWQLSAADGGPTISRAERAIALPADSSKITDHVVWPIPADASGDYRVEMELIAGDGTSLSRNRFDFAVQQPAA